MTNAARIEADIARIARCTHTPGEGASRPTFSAAWREACDHVITEAVAAGCRVWTDAIGNIHLRPASLDTATPVWLSGSHLDSVPHGGDYDGVVGVVAALECLRQAHDERLTIPLEVVIFAEEEGTTFGLGMLGSRGWVGTLDAVTLEGLRNASGETYWEAGAPHGGAAASLAADRLDSARYLGFLEVHVEQGPGLWAGGDEVSVVTGIAGRRQYTVTLVGVANHAGSTGMADRRDALAGAAEAIVAVESIARQVGPHVVATVGRIAVQPDAVNVIPSRATFTIDLRAPSDAEVAQADELVREAVRAAAVRRQLDATIDETERLPAVGLDSGLVTRVHDASRRLGMSPLPVAVSGALHDAAILAPFLPTVMLFVASRDGVSHNPQEFSRIADIVTASRLLSETIRSTPSA